MGLCSSAHQQNQLSMAGQRSHNVFQEIIPSAGRLSAVRSDVFINHRGPDVKHSLAFTIYHSLHRLGVTVFCDSENLDFDNFHPDTIENVIRSCRVCIAIFSERYAESAWCLHELTLMLRTGTIIIPVFYGVKPSDLRYIEKGAYAGAFSRHKSKRRYPQEKLNEWKEALQLAAFIPGHELDISINDLQSDLICKPIVSAVQEHLKRSQVTKFPVGLRMLVEELENRCLREHFERQLGTNKEISSGALVTDVSENKEPRFSQGKVLVIGIYGMGGAGKTTLSKELFNKYRSKYIKASFLADVRETFGRGELPSLQLKLLQDLFDNHHLSFRTTEEGTSHLRYAFNSGRDCRFLIVLDDIDRAELLNVLLDLDSMDSGSLVIVSTRDEQVLKDAKIDFRYKVNDMSLKDSRELFCWHAFRQENPRSGYEDLVDKFVEVSEFLPLSLQIFGGLVRDKIDKGIWHFYLNKVREQLNPDIRALLQISVDTLDIVERQMLMDIACFFIDKPVSMAINIWEGCGWKAKEALQNLESKCLVRVAENYLTGYEFDDKLVIKMHDHIRDLGRDMADNQSSPRRKWRFHLLESNRFENILRETSGAASRCFNSFFDNSIAAQVTYFLGDADQTGTCLLWLELELDGWEQPSLPCWIPLQQLRSLRIFSAPPIELWQNNSQAPVHLRELVLHECSLAECTNSIGILKDLEKLVLTGRNEGIRVDGRALSESVRGLTKLRSLVLRYFTLTGEFTLGSTAFTALTCLSSSGQAGLISNGEPTVSDSLVNKYNINLQSMEMRGIKLLSSVSISGEYCPNLESLNLTSMGNLIQVDLSSMRKLKYLEFRLCEQLKRVSGNFDLSNLVTLNIVKCGNFEILPSLEHLRCLERIVIDGCEKLQKIRGIEELQQVRCLHLSGDILRCTHKFKKLSSEATSVIGKASHQAKTILDAKQFCDVIGETTNRAIDVSEKGIGSEESLKMINPVCAIIICAVVRGSYASGTNAINICLPSGSIQSNIGGGMWVVTIAITRKEDVIDYKELLTVGNDAQIKKCWMVTINKETGGNALKVFKNIISQLYENRAV